MQYTSTENVIDRIKYHFMSIHEQISLRKSIPNITMVLYDKDPVNIVTEGERSICFAPLRKKMDVRSHSYSYSRKVISRTVRQLGGGI